MGKLLRKVSSYMLVIAIAMGIIIANNLSGYTTNVYATDIVHSGTWGDNIRWTIDSDGVLELEGEGTIEDSFKRGPDWCDYKDEIKKAVIGYGITTIGARAFDRLTYLTEVDIKSTQISTIETYAFSMCDSLKTINIPASVKTIYTGFAFRCDNLETITVDPENTVYKAVNNALIEVATNKLIAGCKNTIIPNEVKEIGTLAFQYVRDLKNIYIPSSVEKIAVSSFDGCSNVERIEVDKNNTHYNSINNCNAIIETEGSTLILGCKNTKIPDTVKKMTTHCFYANQSLTSMVIPSNVELVAGLESCKNLKTVIICDGVKGIQGSAFYGSDNIETIVIPKSIEDKDVIVGHPIGNNNTIIYGYKGTYAEKYANAYRKIFKEIPCATAHSWDEGVVTKEATYSENGNKKYTCTFCMDTKDEVIPMLVEENNSKEEENKIKDKTFVKDSDGKEYWYEDGVRQGTTGRGKEIYDPTTDGWYWLDAVSNGAKATSKDVYQESFAGDWGDILNPDGTRSGKWVRYDENGKMVKGWQTTDAGTYYFDPIYGTMAKGYATIDGTEYYFNTINGTMEKKVLEGLKGFNGWKEVEGKECWYENGVRQGTSANSFYRGKEIYDPNTDAWYWLDNVDGGKKAVSKDVYQESLAGQWGDIVGADGQKYGKWVRYDENGRMIKGWQITAEGTYYFDITFGTMAKGLAYIDGEEHYFNEITGIMER